MTAVMWTYSQVVWAYFILDAATLATSKFIEIPPKNSEYLVKKENVRSEIENFNKKTNSTSKNITTKADELQPLGLFVAQPSNIQELLRDVPSDQGYSNAQPRYAENFGMVATSSEQRYRGIDPKRLSVFGKLDKRKSYYDKKSDKLPKPRGTDKFLTPELYKFKTDIEKETVRTHIRGLKMSPDAAAAPTIIHDKSFPKFDSRYNYRRPNNPVREETFINPYVYDEPYSYEEGPSTPYAKPVSYQQYTPIPRDPYYPSSTGSSYYEPPSDYSFPYYPTPEPDPPHYYHKPSEPDSYNRFSSGPSYNDFPVDYPPSPPIPPINYHDTQGYFPSAKNRETAGDGEEPEDGRSPANDEDDFDKDDFPSSGPTPKTPKKSHRNPNYEVSEYGTDQGETDVKYSPKLPKKSRSRQKFRKPYEEAETAPKEDEDEEFDTNYEAPDAFQEDKDDNLDADEEAEDEPSPPPKQARLRSPSKKQVKRIRSRPSRSRNKRCVKKRKEMSVETEMASGGFDEEPSKKMTCLVCENLDTGGTYETCTYESDPKKNSYYTGNEASYRKGNAKNPYKYRMRRQTVTIINSSLPLKRVVRQSYNLDSVGSFTTDVEDFGNDDFNDDENEDQQEDDDDDMEEYKPTLPAYANEDACTEVSKNGLTCMVCHNPETNGKYKQCSYADDPDKNNFEYAQSSSYGNKKVPYKARNRRQPTKKQKPNSENVDKMQIQDSISKEIKVPSEWKLLRNIEQKKIGAINDNFQKLLHSKEQPDTDALASIGNPSYEEQFLTLFPELDSDHSEESLMGEHSLLKELNEKPAFSSDKNTDLPGFNSKGKLGGYFKKLPKKSILDDDDEDTEMSKMMKEFKTKDRSACKKSTKDKMTCYVCDDKDGIKREECMYITENEPTKVSYQETSQTKPEESQAKSSHKREVYYKSPAKVFKYKYIPSFELKDQPAVGSMIHKTISDKSARKYGSPLKKPDGYSNVKIHTEKTYSLKTLPTKVGSKRDMVGAHTHEQQALASNKKMYKKRKSKPSSEDESDLDEDEHPDPEENGEYAAAEIVPEVDPTSPDGLFSDETKDVYSSELKETLPRYMVQKSEHEKLLDEYMSKM